ncbi:hypothetical protein G3I76_77060, partial [Streptomyces sp. SID11233]|nr:hypothetical protein [Streptomyces sp. SID11233]
APEPATRKEEGKPVLSSGRPKDDGKAPAKPFVPFSDKGAVVGEEGAHDPLLSAWASGQDSGTSHVSAAGGSLGERAPKKPVKPFSSPGTVLGTGKLDPGLLAPDRPGTGTGTGKGAAPGAGHRPRTNTGANIVGFGDLNTRQTSSGNAGKGTAPGAKQPRANTGANIVGFGDLKARQTPGGNAAQSGAGRGTSASKPQNGLTGSHKFGSLDTIRAKEAEAAANGGHYASSGGGGGGHSAPKPPSRPGRSGGNIRTIEDIGGGQEWNSAHDPSNPWSRSN